MRRARVERWGDTLVVRLPPEAAANAGLYEGCTVEPEAAPGVLRFSPALPARTLEEPLAGITPENLPGVLDDRPRGQEQI